MPVICGEELNEESNPVLHFAKECGMHLVFVSREKYRSLRDNSPLADESIFSELRTKNFELKTSQLFVLPEGGSNDLAVKGCEEIISDIPVNFDYICCACGTGTTLAGIINGIEEDQQAIGIVVLKGGEFLVDVIKRYSGSKSNYQFFHKYNFGGYGKTTPQLEIFCQSFIKRTGIPVEPVYTGKLFYGIYDLIRKDFFQEGKTVVIVHTGGVSFVNG